MLNLMDQCDIVEKQNHKRHRNPDTNKANDDNSFQFKNNPFSVFSGILPGKAINCFYVWFLLKFDGNPPRSLNNQVLFALGYNQSIPYLQYIRTVFDINLRFVNLFALQVQNGAEQVCIR